jgi:hypothetical protein
MVAMLSTKRLSRNPATKTATAKPLTGSQPTLSVSPKTAVRSVSVTEKINMARKDCRTRPNRASSQFIPHCLGRPGMIHIHAKNIPIIRRRRQPTNAISAVNAKLIVSAANRVATIAPRVRIPTRPNGSPPFVHLTVAALSPPSALLISLST